MGFRVQVVFDNRLSRRTATLALLAPLSPAAIRASALAFEEL